MTLIAPAEAERLAKICALFSSNHMGERAAAAHKADQLIRAAGLTWPDVLLVTKHDGEQPRATARKWASPADIILLHDGQISKWEREFLNGLMRRSRGWTARQQQIFEEIRDRVAGAAR